MGIKREKCKTDEGEKFFYVLEEGRQVHKDVTELIVFHRGLTGRSIELDGGRKVTLSEHV